MITERILQIIDYKGINKSKFYRDTNLSNGFLDKVKDIGVSKLDNILKAYPDINPVWLLTGKGEMIKKEGAEVEEKNTELKKLSIIDRIIKVRNFLGLISKDFALKSGVDPKNYSSIENKKRPLGNKVLNDICKAFSINKDWLLTGEGEMFLPFSTQNNVNGDNIMSGNNVTVNKNQTDKILDLLEKKDEQIDRLLNIIEKLSK